MNKKWLNKSLSLFAKLIILSLSIWFLTEKVDLSNFGEFFKNIPEHIIPLGGLFILLWTLNLYLDAQFWAKVHRMVEPVGILRAVKINLICYSLNFIAPAQGGDLAGRYLMMTESGNRKKSFFLNIWMYLPRIFARFYMASLSLALLLPIMEILPLWMSLVGLVITWTILFLFYFLLKIIQQKLHFKNFGSFQLEHYLLDGRPDSHEKMTFLGLACLRFLTFSSQFAIVLYLFSSTELPIEIWFAIPVYYLVSSLLPSFAFADFILKSAIAVWVFQPVFENENLLVLTSLSIWIFNIALPAFIGLYFILRSDLYNSLKLKLSRDSQNGHER